MKIYVSISPKRIGGGSNTFSWNFRKRAKKAGHRIVRNIAKADLAIIIAHLAEEKALLVARNRGCKIIHRLDEYFEKNEDAVRREKHQRIIDLNRYTDVTVFQSHFVYNNVYPVLKPRNYRIIHNGGNPKKFHAAKRPGTYIGHVTWGVDTKKRLDLLHEFIKANPGERFLLVGRHAESEYDFNLPNVKLAGRVARWRLPAFYRKMKFLFFPSEKDPCPNTVVEAILSGVPVCYHPIGGSVELVAGPDTAAAGASPSGEVVPTPAAGDTVCGLPLERAREMESCLAVFRENCRHRPDLFFEKTFSDYLSLVQPDV